VYYRHEMTCVAINA